MTFFIAFLSDLREIQEGSMRAERRREIEAQMENERAAYKAKKKHNGFFRFIALIFLLTGGAFFFFVYKLNVLPMKYLIPAAVVTAIIALFNLPALLSSRGRKQRKISATVIALLFSVVFCFGTYYLANAYGFLNNITREEIPTEDFYVLVRADELPEMDAKAKEDEIKAQVKEILDGTTVGAYRSNDPVYAEARVLLEGVADIEFDFDDTVQDTVDSLANWNHDSILLPVATYEAMKGDGGTGIQSTTGILYTVKVPIQVKEDGSEGVDVTKEPFNVFISGVDADGYRSDVNIIATVNPISHEVLLTSIPRDSYVVLPDMTYNNGDPGYDKLTHAGVYGIEELTATIEETFGIEVHYNMTVNYNVVEHLVDAIGGIDVESEFEFTFGEPPYCHFVKGMNHMDGVAALQFARERNAFVDGDMQRNKDQQLVMEAIIKKLTSEKTILGNYKAILDAVGEDLKTSMSSDEITQLIKAQLATMPSWTINKYSIEGDVGTDRCWALGGGYASVVYLNDDDINAAIEEIARATLGEPRAAETPETQDQEG